MCVSLKCLTRWRNKSHYTLTQLSINIPFQDCCFLPWNHSNVYFASKPTNRHAIFLRIVRYIVASSRYGKNIPPKFITGNFCLYTKCAVMYFSVQMSCGGAGVTNSLLKCGDMGSISSEDGSFVPHSCPERHGCRLCKRR